MWPDQIERNDQASSLVDVFVLIAIFLAIVGILLVL